MSNPLYQDPYIQRICQMMLDKDAFV